VRERAEEVGTREASSSLLACSCEKRSAFLIVFAAELRECVDGEGEAGLEATTDGTAEEAPTVSFEGSEEGDEPDEEGTVERVDDRVEGAEECSVEDEDWKDGRIGSRCCCCCCIAKGEDGKGKAGRAGGEVEDSRTEEREAMVDRFVNELYADCPALLTRRGVEAEARPGSVEVIVKLVSDSRECPDKRGFGRATFERNRC
jgi:hypothetical protein